MSAQPPVTTAPATVPVKVRPFYLDPTFLVGAGLFLYLVADNLQGKELNRANVGAAVVVAIVTLGRLAAPYVRSFIPGLDRALVPPGSPATGDDLQEPRS